MLLNLELRITNKKRKIFFLFFVFCSLFFVFTLLIPKEASANTVTGSVTGPDASCNWTVSCTSTQLSGETGACMYGEFNGSTLFSPASSCNPGSPGTTNTKISSQKNGAGFGFCNDLGSTQWNFSITCPAPPAPPGDFSINCQENCGGTNNDQITCLNKTTNPSVNFSWSQSPGATSYQVYRKSSSLGSWIGPVATITSSSNLRYTATVGLNSQNYYYIKAVNSNGFKSCSLFVQGGHSACRADNDSYISSDDGAEANCQLPTPTPTPTPTTTITPTPTPTPTSTSIPTPTPTPTPISPPPIISNIRVTNITSTTATVLWGTNIQADSQVEYCLTFSRCGTTTVVAGQLTTSHNVGLSGLTPNTTYYVWAKSRSGAGVLGTLGYVLFRTSSQTSTSPTPIPTLTSTPTPTPTSTPPPTQLPDPPVISNLQVTNITRASVTITWDTDVPADGYVYVCRLRFFCYPTDSNLNFTTNHRFDIANLRPDTNYYYLVLSSVDWANRIYSRSDWAVFRTELGLVISNVRVVDVTQTTFTVSWDTNYPATSELRICSGGFFCWRSSYVSDQTLTSSHVLTLSGLSPGRNYYYSVRSIDALGLFAGTRYTRITTLQ